jgi:hypothetical protein
MEVFILSVVMVGIAFLALGIGIFILPARKFPETEVGHNRHMRELGITCAKCEEQRSWREMKKNRNSFIKVTELKVDTGILKTHEK